MENNDDMLPLRLAYQAKLPEKIQAIETQWESLRRAGDKQKINDFYKLIHKFHGSSGSYGFMEISNKLGSLEDVLVELQNLQTLTKAQEETIQAHVDDIKQLIKNVL